MGTATRIGMLTPSSNTALEPETYRMLAAFGDTSAHFARIPVTWIDLGKDAACQFDPEPMLAAAALLADAKVDVVAWNGTSGSWLGPDTDRNLTAELSRALGVPATTSTLALLESFRAYGVRRLGLVTPYQADVAAAITGRYASEGVTVVIERHLGLTDNEAFARVGADKVTALIREAASAAVDAVAVVCTNLHSAPLAAELERELGVPLLDSVTATLWHSLLLAGADRPVDGHGILLRSGGTRARLAPVCERLLAGTAADRVTVRLDLPDLGLDVEHPCAQATRQGIRPLETAIPGGQRSLDTIAWLAGRRQLLVQPDFSRPPYPPAALREAYGVKAQMLAPVIRGGALTGWLSVHSGRPRDWGPDDLASLGEAATAVHAVIDCLAGVPARDRAGGPVAAQDSSGTPIHS